MPEKFRIIILGAGFSRPANLPLADELWGEIRKTAANFSAGERAYKFNEDLNHYIAFRKDAFGEVLTPESVNFEDFMRFLDVEHYLGLRGSDTWSEDGNEGTIVTKHLIGKILARQVNALKSVPELYIEFAKRLEANDYVITFNYDTILERALDAIGKPYRLSPVRYRDVHQFSATIDDDQDEVIVLKMHGSIDWFDRTQFENQVALAHRMGDSPPSDVIFSNAVNLGLERIIDGPRPDSDPLKNTFRARNLGTLFEKDLLWRATPRILPPSSMKLLYSNQLNDFWKGIGKAGLLNFGMAIIGFSLPEHDEYAQQILHSLTTNYQGHQWDSNVLGKKKSPLAIVDYFHDHESKEKFTQRYRFVDWSRSNLYGDGFDLASLDKIFA